MKRMFVFSIMLCLMFIFLISSYADIISIPGDFETIQEGINKASDGDTVMVDSGTWTGEGNKDLLLDNPDRVITVTSENGADSTIIDCEGDGRGVIFDGESSVVDGFTIMNGSAPNGGGIACQNASPEILNNIIIYNTAVDSGPNTNTGNGGGILIYGENPRIINNLIAGNSADRYGGGIGIAGGEPTIINNTITENAAGIGGGGLGCPQGDATVVNSIIWGNENGDIVIAPGYTVYISYSDYSKKGGPGDLIEEDGVLLDDPLFEGGEDYHLTDLSPCIGAGGTSEDTNEDIPDRDIEGNPRGYPPDMGAYENPRNKPLFEGSITIISPADGEEFSTDDVVDVVAEVEDGFGDPVADMEVTFEAIGGTIEPTTATTDESGQATTELTVAEGENTVTVTVTDYPDISDSVTVYGGVPSVTIISPADGEEFQTDDVVDVVAEVEDGFGNRVANMEVTFEAIGGTVDPTVEVTDDNGEAVTELTVGGGENIVIAKLEDDISDSVTVYGGVPSVLAKVSDDDQIDIVGQTLPDPLVVQVTDQYDTPVPEVKITFTVTSGGGILTTDDQSDTTITVITDANGEASVTLTLGTIAGDNTVEASGEKIDGTPFDGSPVTFTASAIEEEEEEVDTEAEIFSVTAMGSPAKAGDTITVTLFGEADGNATFSISGVAEATDVEMTEEESESGKYVGSYTAKEGDDVEDAMVTVTLVDAVVNEASMDATEKVTIDTIAEITSVTVTGSPAKALDTIKVTLVGEANGTATFFISGVTDATDVAMTEETPGNYVGSYTAKEGDNVTGATVTATLIDTVGNMGTDETQTVTIDTIPPTIESVAFNKETVTNGEKVLLTVITETSAIVTADISALDITQTQPVTLLESTKLPGVFTVDVTANANLGDKIVTIKAKDAVGNVTTPPREVTIELIPFVFNLTLNAGPNIISIPLANATVNGVTEPIRKVKDLGKILGDMWTLIISLNTETGKFQSFTPKTPGDAKANIDITGTTGLIVVMRQATTLTLKGEPWPEGNIKLITGLNLIGIPLKDENLEKVIDLSTLLGDSVNVIISLDTETGKFQSFTPRTSENAKSNIIIDGGVTFILVMKSANDISVTGKPWSNENRFGLN